MHKFFKYFLRFLTLAIIGSLIWALWYVNTKGFTKSWRNRVQAEFQKHGIAIDIHRLTLNPVRGLIAKNVTIYRTVAAHDEIAKVSSIRLDINFANLIRGRNFINAVDLSNTRLAIPIATRNQDINLEILDLDARISFPPEQIRVSQVSCKVLGINIIASGTLLLPDDYRPEINEDSEPPDLPWLEPLLQSVESLQFPGRQPTLTISFSGDVSSIESITIDNASFISGPIIADKVRVEQVEFYMTYMEKQLELKQMEISDERGELLAKGKFNLDGRKGHIQILSSLDLQPLLAQTFDYAALRELTFFTEPKLEAAVDIDLSRENPIKLIMTAAAKQVGVRSIVFDSLGAQLSWHGENLLVRDFELTHSSGSLRAQMLKSEAGLKANLTSDINPKMLIPLLDRSSILMLNEWEFSDPPRVVLDATGPDFANLIATGTLTLDHAVYRGVELLKANSKLEIADRKVIYKDFTIAREEGTGSGTFIYDFGKGEAVLQNIVSTMYPDKVAQWIDPEFVDDVLPYRFRTPAQVIANGVVKLGGSMGTDLTMEIEGSDTMDYTFLGQDLPLEKVSGTLKILDYDLFLEDFSGQLFGGDVKLQAVVSVDPEDPTYQCTIDVDNADFQSITALYFDYTESEGKVSGRYSFTGRENDPAKMTGSGNVVVLNGDVFAIPFLGPFSELLNTIVPGMGYSVADRATANFNIADGKISTDDFVVLSSAFSMSGGGDIDFMNDRLDFDIRINAKGLPGVLLFPVSKLFEYTADGTMDQPGWKPKLLSTSPQSATGAAADDSRQQLPVEALRIERKETQRANPARR